MTTEQYADAYTAGFSRTVKLLMRFGVRSKQDAQDFAQDAWVKGWIRREQIRDPKVIGAWVNSIALNVRRAHWRGSDIVRDALRPRWDVDEVRFRSSGYHTTNTLDIDRRKLMRMVPVQHRELMRDYYVDGYSSSELGQRWGVNPSTIKIRLMRASDRLRREVVR